MPPLVRALGLADSSGPDLEKEAARRKMFQAALSFLQESRAQNGPELDAFYEDLSGHYRQRLSALSAAEEEPPPDKKADIHKHHRLIRESLRVERQTAVRLRDEGQINDDALRDLEHELDLREEELREADLK